MNKKNDSVGKGIRSKLLPCTRKVPFYPILHVGKLGIVGAFVTYRTLQKFVKREYMWAR